MTAVTASPTRSSLAAAVLALVPLLAAPSLSLAQDTGSILGRAFASQGTPASDAEAWLVDLGRRTPVDPDGSFRFEDVPPGSYLLQVSSAQAGRSVRRIQVSAGTELELVVSLEPLRELDEIVVSASPRALQGFEAAQPLSVLSGSELATLAGASLGETLANEPGVSSSYFGPGASRPIIRGLSGDRVRILEGGVGVGDASSTSPDHAVSIEPRGAQRIEVVRGPATLLYGSSAIGGVINVIDRRIPSERPPDRLFGFVDALAGTVANEVTAAVDLTAGVGSLVLRTAGLRRDTDDYQIPGFAQEAAPAGTEGASFGTLENSFIETTRGTLGASIVRENGYLGAAFGALDTHYGVPGHGLSEQESEPEFEEAPISIDLENRRWDLGGAWRFDDRRLSSVEARFGSTSYEHIELEGREIGTRFLNDLWEGRIEVDHQLSERLGGALGLQMSARDFAAVGDEAFVPPTETDRLGLFAFEQADVGDVRLQIGVRFERQTASSRETALERTFDGFSGSAGVSWGLEDRWTFGLALARSVKFPTAEELFSYGPHLATSAFEVGNPDLGVESAMSLDATVRVREGPLTGSFTVFRNGFDDFIFEARTGEVQAGLPVFAFDQTDATFIGYEAEAEIELFHRDTYHIAVQLLSDYVRAEIASTGEPLPRIPPLTLGTGLLYDGGQFHAHVSARRTTRQDRVAPLEDETAAYTMLEASARYRIFVGGLIHEIILRGTNLTDEEARSHVSFLKAVAPFPGREVQLSYRLTF